MKQVRIHLDNFIVVFFVCVYLREFLLYIYICKDILMADNARILLLSALDKMIDFGC